MAEKKVTADDLKGWYTVDQVYQHLSKPLGPLQAQAAIWRRVRDGMLRTFASRRANRKGKYGTPEPILEPVVIPAEMWVQYENSPSQFWRGEAVFKISGGRYDSDTTVSCFEIRLDPADVEREWPDIAKSAAVEQKADVAAADLKPPADAPPIPGAKHPGGAPRKDYWDDLWAAMGGLVYSGTLNAGSKQKDIEEAMVQWVLDHRGEELSIPAARLRARKLLAELKQAEAEMPKKG